jgi:SAM-dependent methyltransferase
MTVLRLRVADATFDDVVDEAMTRYSGASKFESGMMRGKLRGDPIYRELLSRGIAAAPRIVDLGCGRGQLLSLILAARGGGSRPSLHGIELDPDSAREARRALDTAATIVQGDLANEPIPRCDVVTLLDVAHYLPVDVQDDVLARARAALSPGGRLFVREADAAAGLGFVAVRVSERLVAMAGGSGFRRFWYRSIAELGGRLESQGFSVAATPMGRGTPFANVLLEARAPA